MNDVTNSTNTNNITITLAPNDAVFGRRGRKSRYGHHITQGTKQVWELLQQKYQAHGNVDKPERRILAKAILEQLTKELASNARFLRFVPAQGGTLQSYRRMTDENEVQAALMSMYYNMYAVDKKRKERLAKVSTKVQPVYKGQTGRIRLVPATPATSLVFTSNYRMRAFVPYPPFQDPSGITILSIEEEQE